MDTETIEIYSAVVTYGEGKACWMDTFNFEDDFVETRMFANRETLAMNIGRLKKLNPEFVLRDA